MVQQSTVAAISEALREYQRQGSAPGPLQRLHGVLPAVIERFYPGLPFPILSFQPERRRVLGTYQPTDGLGLPHRISFNSRYAAPLPNLVVTLHHELGHQWQHLEGKPPRNPWYHNRQFIAKLREAGVVTDHRGATTRVEEPFQRFLEEIGVGRATPVEPAAASLPRRQPVRVWRCGCTLVRVYRSSFQAICSRCGQAFRPVRRPR